VTIKPLQLRLFQITTFTGISNLLQMQLKFYKSQQKLMKYKSTQLSANDVFYSFNYPSLCCDQLTLNYI